jgi:hypothetical protein
MLRTSFAALALATTLAAAGCGGSSKTTSTTASTAASPTATQSTATTASTQTTSPTPGPALTRAALIARADAICAHLHAQLATLSTNSRNGFAVVLPRAAAYERAEVAQLSTLTPPASMAEEWQRVLSGAKKFAEGSAKAGEYAQAKNTAAMNKAIGATSKTQQQSLTIAKRAGFKQCSLG